MFTKFSLLVLAAAVCAASTDSGEDGRRIIIRGPATRTRYVSRDSDSGEARYQFAYKVRAEGGGGGYGGRGSSGEDSSEFGHAEQRDGDKTTGKYFVQLPDGRLQTVEYYVTGDSGYVARVSYDGQARQAGGDSGERRRYA